MAMQMQEGVRELMARASAMRDLSSPAPGITEATDQVQIIARAARRALARMPGAHNAGVATTGTTATVRIAGTNAGYLRGPLVRQRDASIPAIRAAVIRDVTAAGQR